MNGTGQTFTAANNFTVRLPGYTGTHRVIGHAFPVLTGNQVWKPKTWIVFYVLSKKYYPLSPQVAAGFQLNTGGRSSTLVPGPSGIFLRLTYDPAKFARQLDWIVAYGQGANGGRRDARPARHGHQRSSSRRTERRISPAISDVQSRVHVLRETCGNCDRSSGRRGRPVAHRGQVGRPAVSTGWISPGGCSSATSRAG